jgi:predicted nucleotidyltransferase
MSSLSKSFLESALARLDSPNIMGVTCAGSHARGQAGPHSDVDLQVYVGTLPESEFDQYTLRRWDDHLVSLHFNMVEAERRNLAHPEHALWAVPGLRQAVILLDKDGSIAELKGAAASFDWSTLQPAADRYAVEQLMGCAEEIHKILNGLASGYESSVLYAVWGALKGLSSAVLVQRGLLVETENRYFDLIQDSVGRDSDWTRSFRIALGADPLTEDVPPFETRGKATLALYWYTAKLFEPIIIKQHYEVIQSTVTLIRDAGYGSAQD